MASCRRPPSPDEVTLTAAVADAAAPPAAYADFAPYQTMTARFLGHPPSFYPTLGIAPRPGLSTHVGLFARCFGVPAVDMRLPGHPTPAARRLAFLAASAAFDCSYCTAHAAGFGDMLRGAAPGGGRGGPRRRRRGGARRRGAAGGGGGVSRTDAAVVAYARAAVVRPLTPDAAAALRAAAADVRAAGLSAPAAQVLAGVVAFAGALNTVMDCMGVTLEADSQRFAMEVLPAAGAGGGKPSAAGNGGGGGGWVPGHHHFNAAPEAGVHVGATAAPPPGGLGGLVARIGAALANIGGMLGTLPAAARGQLLEARLYAGIPTTGPGLRAWVDGRLGAAACPFLANVTGVPLARAFCFGLRENVTAGVGEAGAPAGPSAAAPADAPAAAAAGDAPGTATGGPWARSWSAPERALLLYAFGVATGSAPLTAGAVALGARSGGGRPEAAVAAEAAAWLDAPDGGDGGGGGGDAATERLAAARAVVRASAGGMERVRGAVVERLVAAASPVGAVELASLLSFAEMWRRMEVLFGPEGAAPAA